MYHLQQNERRKALKLSRRKLDEFNEYLCYILFLLHLLLPLGPGSVC